MRKTPLIFSIVFAAALLTEWAAFARDIREAGTYAEAMAGAVETAAPGPDEESTDSMKKEIYLAGGCFWGLEKYLSLIPGVAETEVGYANSIVPDPTYEQVCRSDTNAAETVRVVYDETQLSLEELLDLFFYAIDPTSLNKQGNDIGTQYRTGIYTVDDASLKTAKQYIEDHQSDYGGRIVVEAHKLDNFCPAEEYHQKYLDKNPFGYCHIGSAAFEHARRGGD